MDIKDVQQSVFRKLISNPKTLPGYLNKVSPEDFFAVPLAREVIAAFSQNGNAVHYSPSKECFEILLRDRIQPQEKLENASRILASLAGTPEDQQDLDLLIKEIKNERMCRSLAGIIQDVSGQIDPVTVEKTYDNLLRQLLALPFNAANGIAAGKLTEAFSDIEERIAMYFTEQQRKFKCGMSAFDNSIGGFAPGEFIVMTAGTGQGKSAIMLWMAEQFLKNGANVMYVTIEMSYQEVMERYHAMTSGLNLKNIRSRSLSDQELSRYIESIVATGKEDRAGFLRECRESIVDRLNAKYAIELGKKYKDRPEKFFVLDIPKNCSPSRIEKEISRLSVDTPIHICFIDYLNIMEPNFHSRDKVREQASLAQDLKGVFRKLNIIGVAGAQMNTGDMDDNAAITTDDIKYSRAIGENCDWMLAFKRNQDDDIMRQLKIHLVKHRHSAACTALLDADFDHMQFKDLGAWDQSMAPPIPSDGKEAARSSWSKH